MFAVECRTMFRPNGLVDNIILTGTQNDLDGVVRGIGEILDEPLGGDVMMDALDGYKIVFRYVPNNAEPVWKLGDRLLVGPDLECSNVPLEFKPTGGLQTEEPNDPMSLSDWNQRNIIVVSGGRLGLRSIVEFFDNPMWRNGELVYAYLNEFSNKLERVLSVDSCEMRIVRTPAIDRI